jgi:cytochrome P450
VDTESFKSSQNAVKCAVVPISDWLRRVTLDIIGTAGMGYEFNALLDPDNKVNKNYAQVFETPQNSQLLGFIETMETLVPVAWLGNLPLKYNLDIKASAKKIREIFKALIAEKIQKLSNDRALDSNDGLAVAIRSGKFSGDNLVDQVMTFLAAGHETVSTAMSWALLALCQYPEIQTRLRSEVRAQIASPADDSVT